jgi:hypothetical protein
MSKRVKIIAPQNQTDIRDGISSAAENAEDSDYPPIRWDEVSASSANSATGFVQKAVLPPNSILSDWFEFARERTEGADCYIAGAILPVTGALLERRIWMPLAGGRKYPNVFSKVCGKPGDRKSTTIRLGASVARECLPANAFIPESFSPESLFDEYDEFCGGRPDKLWIVDDANSVLTDWQKTANGERNATRFLNLYDCQGMAETFRRNKKESHDGQARRIIPVTSTNIVFGVTFNVACFQGQSIRAGMARRFLDYVAEQRGRTILDAVDFDERAFEELVTQFKRCLEIGGRMVFSPDAECQWRIYQTENRAKMDAANPLAEDLIARLASAPAQVLAVAMIFEAAMWAKRGGEWQSMISLEALVCAIEHLDESLKAASRLDAIAHRVTIAEDAEVMYEKIIHDFGDQKRGDTVYASRSDLTRTYCHDSGRRGALKPHDLYNRLIPALTAQGKAILASKDGKKEVYAFKVT